MKIRLSSVFELSKYIQTEAGSQLKEALEYISQLSQQLVHAMDGKITYADNFNAKITTIQFISGQTTIIDPGLYRVTEVRVRKIISDNNYVWNSFGWNYASNGQIQVSIGLVNSPASVNTAEIILYY